jgi:hypothetical protein
VHEVAERGVDFPLASDSAQPGKGGALDGQRKMAFAPRIVTGVP